MTTRVLLRVYTGINDGVLRWVCPKCGRNEGGGEAGSGKFNNQVCSGCGGGGYIGCTMVRNRLAYFDLRPSLKVSEQYNQKRQYDSLLVMDEIYSRFPESWRVDELERGAWVRSEAKRARQVADLRDQLAAARALLGEVREWIPYYRWIPDLRERVDAIIGKKTP